VNRFVTIHFLDFPRNFRGSVIPLCGSSDAEKKKDDGHAYLQHVQSLVCRIPAAYFHSWML
jgi:hypothetical protein